MLSGTQDNEEIIERVAALDIGKADPVAFGHPGDAAADALDNADTFVTRHEGGRGLHRPVAIRGMHVGMTQA